MLKIYYEKINRSDLLLKNKYKNTMQIPEIKKIIINIATKSKNKILEPLLILEMITGQKGIILKSKKSISTFNLRKGLYLACKVTLINNNMYNFIMKLIQVIIPHITEYKILSIKNIDKNNNYTLSINNSIIFPEIEYSFDIFSQAYGMDISIVTSVKSNLESKILLSSFQFPFK